MRLAFPFLLIGFVGSACDRDDFGPAYRKVRSELIQGSMDRFGPGRLAYVAQSVQKTPAGKASDHSDIYRPGSTASARNVGNQLAVEYAKRGLRQWVERDPEFAVEEVISDYELAFPVGQGNPHFVNDYAVVLLERGLPRDLILAAEYAAQARDIAIEGPFDLESAQTARFNWAVALEQLALHGQASAAWQDVLNHEVDPAWRREAQSHIRDLARRPVARWPAERERLRQAAAAGDLASVSVILAEFRSATRLWVEEEELKTWSQAFESDPPRAREALAIARGIGEALEPTDALLADVIAGIDSVTWDTQKTRALVTAMRHFFDGLEAYQEFDHESARPRFAAAAPELSRLASPLSLWAEFYVLATSDHLGLAARLDVYDSLLEKIPSKYSSLRAHVRYRRGRSQLLAGYPEASLSDLEGAVGMLEQLGETDLESAYRSQLADALYRAHYLERADREDALWIARSSRVVHPYYRVFVAMALEAQAYRLNASELLLAVSRESLLAAQDTGRASLLADARTGLYRSLSLLDRSAEAEKVRREIESTIDRLEDPRDRHRSEADLLHAQSDFPPSSGTPSRLDLLRAALDAYERSARLAGEVGSQWVPQRVEVLQDLASELLQAGEVASAREAAEQAFHLLAQRAEAVDEARLLYATEVHPTIILRLLTHRLDNGRADSDEDLFFWAERGHHISAPGSWVTPKSAGQIQKEIPDGTTLVEFVHLDRQIFVLVLRRNSLTSWWLELPEAAALLDCLDARSAGCDRPWDDQARRFALTVVEPWLCRLPEDERLVLVPGSLARLPFAGLPIQCEGEPRKRFVQRHASSLVPSATFWTQARDRGRQLASASPPTHAVAIGIREAAGFLTELRYAEAEAEAVVSLYPRGQVLLGSDASQTRIQEEAARADVIHLATHGAIDLRDPNGSYLALSEGRLQVADLAGPNGWLPRSRLAVLSACETGGSIEGIQGLIGVSRAFLAVGVPSVVATLSPVDDRSSKELMVQFHKHYPSNDDVAMALASAQRLIQEDEFRTSAPSWASWVVIGQ